MTEQEKAVLLVLGLTGAVVFALIAQWVIEWLKQ